MNKLLPRKVAVVTGGGRGIGRAISLRLGEAGVSVVVAGRTAATLEETTLEIRAAGGEGLAVVTDVSDENSVKRLVQKIEEHFGRLDIVVNNAGVTHSSRLEETSTQAWDQCHTVNARGPFILCREVLPLLRRAKGGYIVNISSVVGVKGYAYQTAYTASKHALRGMSIALAEELKGENIRVHVICPGGVATDMVSEVRPDIKPDELIAPDEIAELVLYLVTHRGNAVVDEIHVRRATAGPWF
jgi:3-oxoacyl-[acyl-carrier protein] reductase